MRVPPWGTLIQNQAGNVYGTTVVGSDVYELSPTSRGWKFDALYTDGAGPGVVLGQAGNLYGAIGGGNYFGIGAIGELSPGSDGWTYTDLANFNPSVGYAPPAPPIWDGKAICSAPPPMAASRSQLVGPRSVAGSFSR
jgi:hypothetical protein